MVLKRWALSSFLLFFCLFAGLPFEKAEPAEVVRSWGGLRSQVRLGATVLSPALPTTRSDYPGTLFRNRLNPLVPGAATALGVCALQFLAAGTEAHFWKSLFAGGAASFLGLAYNAWGGRLLFKDDYYGLTISLKAGSFRRKLVWLLSPASKYFIYGEAGPREIVPKSLRIFADGTGKITNAFLYLEGGESLNLDAVNPVLPSFPSRSFNERRDL